jgi:hypothetical protein
MAAAHRASLFRGLDDDLRPVDMAGDDVAAGSTRAFADSASLTGIDQSPVKMTRTVAFELTDRAPSKTELMLLSTLAIGFAATNPILLLLVQSPAATPFT